jgi:diguanylate cyclase (GGDEF)-like protein
MRRSARAWLPASTKRPWRCCAEQFNAQQRAIQIESLRRENGLQDQELRRRRAWQIIASSGAALALLLCGFVFRLYRRSRRTQLRLEELNAELAFHSTHDALTGLLNRRSFREHMLGRQAQTKAQDKAQGEACYILLDLDHFKAINDRHGHGAGDEVLVEAARRLRAAVGERGLAMRWGGEEFLVYVEKLERSEHAALVRGLLDALAAHPVRLEDGQALTVTVTAGALSMPGHAADREDDGVGRGWQHAVALADRALYRGKQGGRNRAWLIDGADPRLEQLILPSGQA